MSNIILLDELYERRKEEDFVIIAPQAGVQADFVTSKLDVVFYGGQAGGGKSHGLMLAPIPFLMEDPNYNATLWRRTEPQLKMLGGLIREAKKIYPRIGGKYNNTSKVWRFPSGAELAFMNMQYESTESQMQGGQFSYAGIDEITTFVSTMFWMIMSRMRSASEGGSFVRATCNPDFDSWVLGFIRWWICKETGFAIPERSGVPRYFYRDHGTDDVAWFAEIQEAMEWWIWKRPDQWERVVKGQRKFPFPASFTFINAKVQDNQKLLDKNPEYEANLENLPREKRLIYGAGCWHVKMGEGAMFKREDVQWLDAKFHKEFTGQDGIPRKNVIVFIKVKKDDPDVIIQLVKFSRGWDFGASIITKENPDPDFTCGVLLAADDKGNTYMLDMVQGQLNESGIEALMLDCAQNDPVGTMISFPQDPGGSGKNMVVVYSRLLSGYDIHSSIESRGDHKGDGKRKRFQPFASASQQGVISIMIDDFSDNPKPWNRIVTTQFENMPDKQAHDDAVDATSRAFSRLHLGEDEFPIDNLF